MAGFQIESLKRLVAELESGARPSDKASGGRALVTIADAIAHNVRTLEREANEQDRRQAAGPPRVQRTSRPGYLRIVRGDETLDSGFDVCLARRWPSLAAEIHERPDSSD